MSWQIFYHLSRDDRDNEVVVVVQSGGAAMKRSNERLCTATCRGCRNFKSAAAACLNYAHGNNGTESIRVEMTVR